jgi:hypothetical protein
MIDKMNIRQDVLGDSASPKDPYPNGGLGTLAFVKRRPGKPSSGVKDTVQSTDTEDIEYTEIYAQTREASQQARYRHRRDRA